MLNLINLLQETTKQIETGEQLCNSLQPVLRIVGIVVFGIKVIVPIILIIYGMIDLAKSVAEKDEGKIKEAQNRLIKRAIAAVLVFLVVTLVSVVMRLIGHSEYTACMDCIDSPFSCTEEGSDKAVRSN